MTIKSTKLLFILYLFLCSSISAESPVVIRAAIDIGMGGPKLQVAEVDLEANRIVRVLHTERYYVNFYDSLSQSVDNRLSAEVMTQGLEALREAIQTANLYKAEKIVAIATASFRLASNGIDFADAIHDQTGIKVHVIDQILEGKLAFQAAHSMTNTDPKNLVVWDIGGGSTQLICHTANDELHVDCSVEGIGAYNDFIIGTIQCRDMIENKTPNPMSHDDIGLAIAYARDLSQKVNIMIKDRISQSNTIVVGVGNAFGYGIASMVGKTTFSLDEITQTAWCLADKTDEDLGGGEFAFCEGSNVLYALGFMQGLNIGGLQILRVNNTDGALVYDPFWK